MNAKKEQDEPTMEEILASIRRIISEEGEPEDGTPEDGTAASSEPLPMADEPEIEDVLDLTDIVEPEPEPEPEPESLPALDEDLSFDELEMTADDSTDPAEISLDEGFAEDSTPEPEPTPAAETETPPAFFAAPPENAALSDDGEDAVDPAPDADAIMSDLSAENVRSSFGQLSDLIVAGYAGADKTLEGMVREMLKPMLKTWLDQNLPPIVERTVAREIARLARVKKP